MTDNAEPVFILKIPVTDLVIDGNGHVNNVAFVQWMQDVAVAHFRTQISEDQMKSWGCTWVARSHHIEYLRPALPGDEIDARTWIVNWRRVRSTRKYEFRRAVDQTLLAQGETDWVLIDIEKMRPRSIPEEIQSAFVPVPDENSD